MTKQSFKTLQQWLNWQETLHPSEIELGLDRIKKVLKRLLPENCSSNGTNFPYKVITVAGTNGKGSTVAFLESILAEASYKVGCYSSPHLLHYNERIRINKNPVSDVLICEAFSRIDKARQSVSLTYFEFGTLAAIDIFTRAGCDVVILEVGLGGRLDAVNIVDPDIALITTVDIDHQDWLGNDRDTIGLEKAGIYRLDRPALYGDEDIPQSIIDKVKKERLAFYQYKKHYAVNIREQQWDFTLLGDGSDSQSRFNLPLPGLKGQIQIKNAANALMVLELLKNDCPVTQAEIKRGLHNCQLAGRFQVYNTDPFIVMDVAHNVQAARVLLEAMKNLSIPGELHVIIGMLKDKEVSDVLSMFASMVTHWYIIELDSYRAMPAAQIEHELRQILSENANVKPQIHCYETFEQAYGQFDRYNKQYETMQKLLIFGSFLTVTEALKTFQADTINS